MSTSFRNISNVFLFLPYYFNVGVHFKNLFSPWKRIVSYKKQVGFSWDVLGEQISTNLVSRGIGFMMRSFVIFEFFAVIIVYMMLIVPLWSVMILFSYPFLLLKEKFFPSNVKRLMSKVQFVKDHLLDEKNRPLVEAWFEKIYAANAAWEDHLSLTNLLSIPPVGRDWNSGFTPTLDSYSVDITENFQKSTHLIGRKEEVQFVERELIKTEEANVILVGDEGVGKHTIINELAYRMYSGVTIPGLQNMRTVVLNMEKALAARENYDEEMTFLEELLAEAAAAKNIVLVLDDFHKYCSKDLVGDYSSLWEKFGKTPFVKFLAVTTPFFYQQVVYSNEKIQRLFTKVEVKEVTAEKTIAILEDKVPFFESKYKLVIPFETLEHLVNRCEFYIPAVQFPQKAIKLLDEVCIWFTENNVGNGHARSVQCADIDKVLSQRTRIPVGALTPDFKEKLLKLESILNEKIKGQVAAMDAVARTVQRAFIEENRKKPKASMLFLGPTGVGKTETAKILAEVFFGKRENMVRFDMSFYQEQKSVSELIGSFQLKNPGLLAATIRENPYCVLLIDEIEKAHKDILSIFLTMLDEGYLVDGFGEKVDCKNLIIVATSNAGAAMIRESVSSVIPDRVKPSADEIPGSVPPAISQNELSSSGLTRGSNSLVDFVISQGIFTPEFVNRFDNVLVFEPLTLDVAYAIGAHVVNVVKAEYMKTKGIDLKVDIEKIHELIRARFNPQNGARDIDRTVRDYCADLVAQEVLSK